MKKTDAQCAAKSFQKTIQNVQDAEDALNAANAGRYKMAKIKVTDECIGCGACVAVCSDMFEMEGNKAKPKKAEVDDIGCAKEAADGCPVNAVKIEE